MKKIMFVFGFLCFCSWQSHAQYQSLFGNVQTSWNVLHESASNYVTDSLVAGEDTTINLNTYKKILYYHLRHDDQLPPILEATAYVREDLAAGKGWILYDPAGTEQLFMDLSLQLNEPYFVAGLNYPVDSVYTLDGRKHVRVQYGYPTLLTDYPVTAGQLTFIEGVGTTYGFTYNFGDSGAGGFPAEHWYPFLMCSWKDNDHIYTHENQQPFFDGCYKEDTIVGIGNDRKVAYSSINVYPNPASEIIVIEATADVLIESVTLINLLGESTCTVSELPAKTAYINVSGFPDGIYFIRVVLSNNKTVTQKIVVKK